MKKTRRWLALLLAVTLVGSNALYQLGTSMSASETETTAESVQQDESAAASETQSQDTASLNQQDTGGVKVQEVTPQTSSQNTQSQNNTSNNTSVTSKNTQAAQNTEQTQAAPEEKTYNVTIKKSDVDGGTIKAWGSDGNKTDVTYNSENKYVKEVKEGETFNFEITAKDTYKVAKVTDQNGTTVQPKAVNNNVYTYEVKNITAERIYSITYEKEKTQETASNGDQKKSDDEKSDDADDDGESEPAAVAPQVQSGVATQSISGATTVEAGSSIVLSSNQGAGYTHLWTVSDGTVASISGSNQNATLTGKKAGTVTVTHEWGRYYGWGNRNWTSSGKETYSVTVTKKPTTRVYVYVKLDTASGVDTSGWTVNKDGWYTIGYVDLSSDVLPSASEKTKDTYYSEYMSAVQAAMGNIHYFSTNLAVAQGIDLSSVGWNSTNYGLKVADGASDYGSEAPSGTNQWHLDGLLTIREIEKHNVTINYVYEDGSEAAPSKVFENVETGNTVSWDSPEITGYTPDQTTVSVTVLKDDVTVTVTYKRNYPKEKITITANSNEKPYDGTALTDEGYTYTQNILLSGDTLTAVTEGSQTDRSRNIC